MWWTFLSHVFFLTNRVVTYNVVDDFSPNAAACGLTPPAFHAALQAAHLQVNRALGVVLQLLQLFRCCVAAVGG